MEPCSQPDRACFPSVVRDWPHYTGPRCSPAPLKSATTLSIPSGVSQSVVYIWYNSWHPPHSPLKSLCLASLESAAPVAHSQATHRDLVNGGIETTSLTR